MEEACSDFRLALPDFNYTWLFKWVWGSKEKETWLGCPMDDAGVSIFLTSTAWTDSICTVVADGYVWGTVFNNSISLIWHCYVAFHLSSQCLKMLLAVGCFSDCVAGNALHSFANEDKACPCSLLLCSFLNEVLFFCCLVLFYCLSSVCGGTAGMGRWELAVQPNLFAELV